MKNIVLSCIILLLIISCQENKPTENAIDNVDSLKVEFIEDVDNATDLYELKPAPEFSLEDLNGKQKSLADYKGKYVLLDIWATWCGPCIMQIPAMKSLEERYKEKNLTFLSISVDADRDKSKWINMINEKKMGGEHLFAGQSSGFSEAYQVDFIPRFILIDTNGNILMDNLPQPMDPYTEDVNPQILQILDMIK